MQVLRTLTEIQGQRRFMAAMAQVSQKVDQANEAVSSRLERASETVVKAIEGQSARFQGTPVGGALRAAEMVAALGSAKMSAEKHEGLTMMLNHTPGYDTLRSLLNDLRGMTDTNKPLMRLINPVKAQIDKLRQGFREGVPAELEKGFSRKLKREEWSRMHSGIGKTDIMILGRQEANAPLKDPSQATQLIQDAEERVKALGGKLANRYQEKAKALAAWMVRGEVSSENLLRNAHAIAHLFGEQGNLGRTISKQVTDDLIAAIDRLTSLYAFDLTNAATKETLRELSETEGAGFEQVVGFHATVRQMEIERRDEPCGHPQRLEGLCARPGPGRGVPDRGAGFRA